MYEKDERERRTLVVPNDVQQLFPDSKRREVLALLLQRACLRERAHARRGLQVARELGFALVVLLLFGLGFGVCGSCACITPNTRQIVCQTGTRKKRLRERPIHKLCEE